MKIDANKILEIYNHYNGFGKALGMSYKVLGRGKVEYRMKIEKKHLATPIAAHGGAISGLLDATLGVTALTYYAEEAKIVSTVELKMNFLNPALENDELIALGEVVSAGKRLLYAEATIYKMVDKQKVLIAKGAGTFNAYPAHKANIIVED